MTLEHVLERRRAARNRLVAEARRYVEDLARGIPLRAAVVIGSVARGDFNRWSDVDLLLLSDALPERLLDRLTLLEPRPPGIQPIPWTGEEWRHAVGHANPIAVEATRAGIWLLGSPSLLET